MILFRAASSGYRNLIVVALGALVLTGCRQGLYPTATPLSVEVAPESVGGIEIGPANATAVVSTPNYYQSLPREEQPVYYLYILDRDGVPVQRFECDGRTASYNDTGRECDHPNGTHTVVSEVVPTLLTPERLPLKGEQP